MSAMYISSQNFTEKMVVLKALLPPTCVWRLSVHRATIKIIVSVFNTSFCVLSDHKVQNYTGTAPPSRSPSRRSNLRTGHLFGSLLLPITLGQRPFGLGTMNQTPTTDEIRTRVKVDPCLQMLAIPRLLCKTEPTTWQQ